MSDGAKEKPATSEEAAGLQPAGAGREESDDEAARRQMCACLVKILLNASRDFELAAYALGKR
jgi:hypothetical protein